MTAVEQTEEKKDEKEITKSGVNKEVFSETDHEIVINGQIIKYKAVAGNYILKDENDRPKGSMFFVSYTKQDVKDYKLRPITFCFNGGPGSSSVWLHLGFLGPKRVFLTEKGDPVAPFQLIDNEYSLLDETDLVFIDPISTGYSRAIPHEDAKKFHGVEEDVKSVGEFIRLYVTRNNRWDSPKFLAGESYGTTRAAGLAGYLQDELYMNLNGLLLISSVLNFQSIIFDQGNDLAYLMFLPSYTSTAWFHRKLPEELQTKTLEEVVEESREFTINEYSLALFKGNLLKPEEKQKMADRLSFYTGLSSKYILDSELRVDQMHFVKELLRNERRTIGRFDSRFKGIDSKVLGEEIEYDPSAEAIFGAFTATLNNYLRTSLKWDSNVDYKILTNLSNWNYTVATNQYLNVTDKLQSVMTRNPYLRVFVANGYYDLATPFFGMEYTVNHLAVEIPLAKRIWMKYYEAGHMMYIHYPSLVKLKQDTAQFFKETLKFQKEEEK